MPNTDVVGASPPAPDQPISCSASQMSPTRAVGLGQRALIGSASDCGACASLEGPTTGSVVILLIKLLFLLERGISFVAGSYLSPMVLSLGLHLFPQAHLEPTSWTVWTVAKRPSCQKESRVPNSSVLATGSRPSLRSWGTAELSKRPRRC